MVELAPPFPSPASPAVLLLQAIASQKWPQNCRASRSYLMLQARRVGQEACHRPVLIPDQPPSLIVAANDLQSNVDLSPHT